MPEWTGTRRTELYRYLAEGRIAEAHTLLDAHKDLKKNDLKPVNREALAAMSQAIARKPEPQRELIAMLCSPLRPVRACARMLFDFIDEFSGDLLAEAYPDLAREIIIDCKILVLDSYHEIPKGLNVEARRKWAVENFCIWSLRKFGRVDSDNDITISRIGEMIINTRTVMTNAMRERLLGFFEVVCLFPNTKNFHWFDNDFKTGLIRFNGKLSDLMRDAEERLRKERLADTVKRTGLRQEQEKNESGIKAANAKKIRKRVKPDPIAGEAPLITQDKDRIFDELMRYDPLFSIRWEQLQNPPPDIKKRVTQILSPLEHELDLELMWRFNCVKASVVAEFLVRSYAGILIANFPFEALVLAARQKAETLRRERMPSGNEWEERSFNRLCEDLWKIFFKARAEIDPLFAISHNYSLPGDIAEDFIIDQEKAAEYASQLESGDHGEMDSAFRKAFENPACIAPGGRTLLELTSDGLWQVKATEAIKAIRRLHALAEFGRCTPAEAAAAIEQAFTIEEPMLWRAAAGAIRALGKKDPSINLKAPDRVREILERDRAKYGKYLAPLLAYKNS